MMSELTIFRSKVVIEFLNTVFARKSAYAQKSVSIELAPPPFDVKYLMSTSLEWALLFSFKRDADLQDSI